MGSDENANAFETQAPRRATDVLLLIIGIIATLSVVCVCLGLSGAMAWRLVPELPTAVPTETPEGYEITQTATAQFAIDQTLTAQPTATPTITPTPTLTPTLTPSPIVAAEEPATATPAAPGPWLILSNGDGLWLLPSGATPEPLQRLTGERIVAPADLKLAISPRGGRAAYVTTTDPDQSKDLTLKLINLPDGAESIEISLIPEGVQAPLEALRAIIGQNTLAWSPDGRYLVFTAISADMSADLFLLSLETREIRTLSDSPLQETNPTWSPDGSHVLFTRIDGSQTSHAGAVQETWFANPQSGSLTRLKTLPGSYDQLIGWQSSGRPLFASRSRECGLFNLRSVDPDRGTEESLLQSCFTTAALDPETGSVLIAGSSAQAKPCACGKPLPRGGIYLLPGGQGEPRLVSVDVEGPELLWVEGAHAFYLQTDGKWGAAFSSQGKRLELQPNVAGALPVVSSASGYTAWARDLGTSLDGLWIAGPFETPRRYFDRPCASLTWRPDGTRLYFTSAGQFYTAQAPTFKAVPLGPLSGLVIQSVWANR